MTQQTRPTWARMAAWAVAALPTLEPREVAWVARSATRHDLVQLTDAEGQLWAVRRTVDEPTAGERLADRLGPDVHGVPPAAVGSTTLADGSVVTVRPWVSGRALRWVMVRPGDPVVGQFARFLAAVHGASPASLASGPDAPTAESMRTARLETLDAAAATGIVPARLLERWEESLEDTDLWNVEPTPVHGRLVDEHVLVSADHELAAVMGWSGVHLGDPAEDFAVVSHAATPDVVGSVRASYDQLTGRTDERMLERARLVAEMRDLPRLVDAHARGDRGVLREVQADLAHRSRLLAEAEELDSWD